MSTVAFSTEIDQGSVYCSVPDWNVRGGIRVIVPGSCMVVISSSFFLF